MPLSPYMGNATCTTVCSLGRYLLFSFVFVILNHAVRLADRRVVRVATQ